ncbi:MAG TPA: flagellar type III secretion system pore protein FliP [Bryobacteraceae bacterium]|nr:flagellar type III secretion system pore protein FliP [Bryobacteraceae bacterium]
MIASSLFFAPLLAAVTPGGDALPNPVVMVIILGALTLAPFVLIMLTSFVKISVVLSILRNALGTQSVPPNQVITGLAFVLSFFIMTPVAKQMYSAAGSVPDTRDMFSESSVKNVFDAIQRGREPLRQFLAKHCHDGDRLLFIELANRLAREPEKGQPKAAANAAPALQSNVVPVSVPPVIGAQGAAPNASANRAPSIDKNDFQVLIPAFVTSQLKEGFEIGFLVFIPFIIIDMVIANILLAMGMSMLSPSVISLPFKLLLFVLVDGWFLIIRGLVLSYV